MIKKYKLWCLEDELRWIKTLTNEQLKGYVQALPYRRNWGRLNKLVVSARAMLELDRRMK